MIETYRFRLYPTEGQKVLLRKHFGCSRFIYNWALDYNKKLYETEKKYKNSIAICSTGELIRLKEEKEWLKEVNSQSLIASIGHLDKAFRNFFRGQCGFPRFKKKDFAAKSFEVPQHFELDFKTSSIQIPKFSRKNKIKCRISRRVNLKNFIKYGTAIISENACGQFFVSFIVHRNEQLPQPVRPESLSTENSLGFDFGLKHFLTTSDGRKFDSPQFFKSTLKKLAKEQRKLSRKKKGSRNYDNQRIRVARVHNKIANQRRDFLHKLSVGLVRENQFDCFCFEDLNLKGMVKLWGRKVNDLSYCAFLQMVQYKAAKVGKASAKIGRFDASSQICSNCGHRQKMPMDVRTYVCPECGMEMDRDVNAAINIRDIALKNILKNTDGASGINACGVGGSGSGVASRPNETADGEARMFSCRKGESQPSSVAA